MRALVACFSASDGMASDNGGVTPSGFAPGVAMAVVEYQIVLVDVGGWRSSKMLALENDGKSSSGYIGTSAVSAFRIANKGFKAGNSK